MHADQIIEAERLAQPYAIVLSATLTGCPLLVIQYVPDLGTGGAAATCLVSATNLKFRVDAASPAGLDLIGSTGGCLDFATYTNLGLLADAINGTRAWRCYLQGGLRGDSAAWLDAITTGRSVIGDNGATFHGDLDITDCVSVALSGEKFVNNGIAGHVTDADDKCRSALNRAVVDMPDSYTIQIWTAGQKATPAAEKLYESASAISSSTVTTLGSTTDMDDIFQVSKWGERLVIRAVLATASANLNTIDKFEIQGKTFVLSGSRLVSEDNF